MTDTKTKKKKIIKIKTDFELQFLIFNENGNRAVAIFIDSLYTFGKTQFKIAFHAICTFFHNNL